MSFKNTNAFNSPALMQRGFSLVELTVVLLLITLIASVAVRETSELGFQARFEQTKERLEMIKQAIVGNPRQITNGQQAIGGFAADMGRLPNNLHELLEQNFCSLAGYTNQVACEGASGIWTAQAGWSLDPVSGLSAGWRGPYLETSASPNSPDAFSDAWGNTTVDDTSTSNFDESIAFYGWRFLTINNQLFVQSMGKDQLAGGWPTNDFNDDYPANITYDGSYYYPAPVVRTSEWLVDVSGGLSVSFLKSKHIVPYSFCSDPSKTTEATCSAPAAWFGGCSIAGYYNKSSCEAATPTAGAWPPSSSSPPPLTLSVYCSDPTKSNLVDCISPAVWHGCLDDVTKTTQVDCINAGQTWFVDLNKIPLNSLPETTANEIFVCMKLFYRNALGQVAFLTSDADVTDSDADPLPAAESQQITSFHGFRDQSTNLVAAIPAGSNAIGIYQYNGSDCATSNVVYPVNRQAPIQVDMRANTSLPVINW